MMIRTAEPEPERLEPEDLTATAVLPDLLVLPPVLAICSAPVPVLPGPNRSMSYPAELALPSPSAVRGRCIHSVDYRIAKRQRLAAGRGAHCVDEQVGTNDDKREYEVPADLGEVGAGV